MSLFDALGRANTMPPGMGNMQNVMNRFQQFRQMFTGDPRQQIQRLLDSGRVSQSQYNQAVQMARQLQNMLK